MVRGQWLMDCVSYPYSLNEFSLPFFSHVSQRAVLESLEG